MKIPVHSKEKFYLAIMMLVSSLIYGMLIAAPFLGYWKYVQSLAIMLGVFFVISMIGHVVLVGFLRGNAIRVTPNQFPEAHEILVSQSEKLGLKKVPAMYLLQGAGVLNAFATRFAGRSFVVLYSSVLEAAYQEDHAAVEFIIGHELGHIKRNHVGSLKSLFLLPANMVPFLSSAYSRACEYTCDMIGHSVCPEGAVKGMVILASGKQLSKRVNVQELVSNAYSESGFATWLAEIFSTHPHVVKRITLLEQLPQEKQDSSDSYVQPSFMANADKSSQQEVQH